MDIKTLSINDVSQLNKLYFELSGKYGDLEKTRQTIKRILNDPAYHLLGAYINGELVGTVMGVVCQDAVADCRPFMQMKNMVVKEDFQGRGIGKALMCELENIAKEKNCVFIQFCSSMFRVAAHAFYEKCGYAPDTVKGYRKYFD